MSKKSLFAILGVATTLIVGVAALETSAHFISGMASENQVEPQDGNHHENFTGLLIKENKPYLHTSEGTDLEVKFDSFGQSDSYKTRIATFNKGQTFTLVDPIGGLIKLELGLTINNEDYKGGDVNNRAFQADYGYFTKKDDINSEIYWVKGGDKFTNIYEWGDKKQHETPSVFKLTALQDNIDLKSMKIDYTCKHLDFECLDEKVATYVVGTFGENNKYPFTTRTGVYMQTHGDKEWKATVDLKAGDQFSLKQPLQDKRTNIELIGAAFVDAKKEGLITINENGDTFTCHADGKYNLYFNFTTNQMSINTDEHSISDFFLVGEHLEIGEGENKVTVDGKPGWAQNVSFKLDKVENGVYTLNKVTLTAGKPFKIRTIGDTWYNNVDEKSRLAFLDANDAGGNLMIHETGEYNITVKNANGHDAVTIYIEKYVPEVLEGFFIKDSQGNTAKFNPTENNPDGKKQLLAVYVARATGQQITLEGNGFNETTKKPGWTTNCDAVQNGQLQILGATGDRVEVVTPGTYNFYLVYTDTGLQLFANLVSNK